MIKKITDEVKTTVELSLNQKCLITVYEELRLDRMVLIVHFENETFSFDTSCADLFNTPQVVGEKLAQYIVDKRFEFELEKTLTSEP